MVIKDAFFGIDLASLLILTFLVTLGKGDFTVNDASFCSISTSSSSTTQSIGYTSSADSTASTSTTPVDLFYGDVVAFTGSSTTVFDFLISCTKSIDITSIYISGSAFCPTDTLKITNSIGNTVWSYDISYDYTSIYKWYITDITNVEESSFHLIETNTCGSWRIRHNITIYANILTNPPTDMPTDIPTNKPTMNPSFRPSNKPTEIPTYKPSMIPSNKPTNGPTVIPSRNPTYIPSKIPTDQITFPTVMPSREPSAQSIGVSIVPTSNDIFSTVTNSNTATIKITKSKSNSGNVSLLSDINSSNLWIYIGVGVASLLILISLFCCVFWVFCKYNRNKNNNNKTSKRSLSTTIRIHMNSITNKNNNKTGITNDTYPKPAIQLATSETMDGFYGNQNNTNTNTNTTMNISQNSNRGLPKLHEIDSNENFRRAVNIASNTVTPRAPPRPPPRYGKKSINNNNNNNNNEILYTTSGGQPMPAVPASTNTNQPLPKHNNFSDETEELDMVEGNGNESSSSTEADGLYNVNHNNNDINNETIVRVNTPGNLKVVTIGKDKDDNNKHTEGENVTQ